MKLDKKKVGGIAVIFGGILLLLAASGNSIGLPCSSQQQDYTISGDATIVAQYTTFPVQYTMGASAAGVRYWTTETNLLDCIITPRPMAFDIRDVRVYASLDGSQEQAILNKDSIGILIPASVQSSQFKFVEVAPGAHTLRIRSTWDANQHERIDTFEIVTHGDASIYTATMKGSVVVK